ncbi:MAG: serine hydrolase domain-containing protein, partial [Flavobacterium sp.]
GKVKTYLPDFPYESTTVRTLLNHRSGLPHYSRFSESVKGWNHKKTLTNSEVLDYLKRYRFSLLFKTDTKFNYCNTNYAMLALIIEQVTGSDYAAAMEEWLFRPLGMKDSFVFDYFTQKEIVSQSYKSTKVNYGWDQFDAIYGDKNIYSTPRDLAKFDLATYAPGFLRKDLWQEALNGYSYEKNGVNNYGLGYRMKEFETGQKVVFHNGWWHGNTSSYVTLKKDTVAIIGISNRYTKKVYQSMKLSALFGDYPFELADME